MSVPDLAQGKVHGIGPAIPPTVAGVGVLRIKTCKRSTRSEYILPSVRHVLRSTKATCGICAMLWTDYARPTAKQLISRKQKSPLPGRSIQILERATSRRARLYLLIFRLPSRARPARQTKATRTGAIRPTKSRDREHGIQRTPSGGRFTDQRGAREEGEEDLCTESLASFTKGNTHQLLCGGTQPDAGHTAGGPQVLGGPGKSSTHCSGQQSGDGAGLGPEGVLLLNGSEQRRDFQAAPSKDATTKFGW